MLSSPQGMWKLGDVLTLPAIGIDEKLCEGCYQERQSHSRAGDGVGESQLLPAALGRHHRCCLVKAAEPHACNTGGSGMLVPRSGCFVS